MDGHLAGHAHRAFVAVVVNGGDAVAGVALAHAAGLGGPPDGCPCGIGRLAPHGAQAEVAHDVVHLGLAKHFVHHHAQLLAAVGKHGVAHGLARAHQALQLELELLARAGAGLHHGLQGGGEQKAVRHAVALQQGERHLGAEAPVVGHDGAAKVQRGQQRVHQPPGPGPVGGRPEHGLAAGRQGHVCRGIGPQSRGERQRTPSPQREAKTVLAAHKTTQVAHQRPVRNEAALGVAGGAAGVNQHGGFVCGGVGAGEVVGRGGQGGLPAVHRGGARHRRIKVAHHHDVAQRGAVGAHFQQVGQRGGVAQGHGGGAVLQAVGQGLGAKQHGQGHAHPTRLQHTHVSHGGFKPLGHHDGHPVAPRQPPAAQHLRQTVGVLLQLKI